MRALVSALALVSSCHAARGERELADAAQPSADAGTRAEALTSFDDFCRQRSQQTCGRLRDCCAATLRIDLCSSFASATNLSSTEQPRCDRAAPAFDLGSAERCLQLHADSYQSCGLERLDSDVRQSAARTCAKVAPPVRLPSGASCPGVYASVPCESPTGTYAFCDYVSEGGVGTCQKPRPLLVAHQRCAQQDVCIEGLHCRSVDLESSRTCELFAQDGEYCQFDADCGSGTCVIDASERRNSRCATEPASLIEEHCDEARAIAQDAIYALSLNAHADNLWPREAQLFWLDGKQLFSAPRDGSAAPVLRNQLTTTDYIWRGAVDARRLWALTVRLDLWEIPFDGSPPSQPQLDLAPAAIAADEDALWVTDHGCQNVERIGADRVTRWAVAAEPSEEQVERWSTTLLAHEGDVYCAFGAQVWRLSVAEPQAQPLASPGDDVAWLGAGQDELIARVISGDDRALYGWSIAQQSWQRWKVPTAQEVEQLSVGAVEPSTGRIYARGGPGLIALARTDSSTQLITIAKASQASSPRVKDGFVYWQGSGLIWRHATF